MTGRLDKFSWKVVRVDGRFSWIVQYHRYLFLRFHSANYDRSGQRAERRNSNELIGDVGLRKAFRAGYDY